MPWPLLYIQTHARVCVSSVHSVGAVSSSYSFNVSVDVGEGLILSGCAETDSIGDTHELKSEDIGTKEDCSCEVALGFMINRFGQRARTGVGCRVGVCS